MGCYKSCNCFQCRNSSPAVKKMHKRKAHKKFRYETHKAIKLDREVPNAISTIT